MLRITNENVNLGRSLAWQCAALVSAARAGPIQTGGKTGTVLARDGGSRTHSVVPRDLLSANLRKDKGFDSF